MRVCTRAGLEKYQADQSADAGNSPRSNGKLGKEKCYASSCGILFRRQISFCVISGTFLWRKLFCNHSRILFVRLSWCLIEWTARTDTIPLVHLHFAAFFSRVALSNGHEQFLFLPWAKSYDTRKKYSIAIKALANYFFVERSRIEKKILSRPFQFADKKRATILLVERVKSTRFYCEIWHFCSILSPCKGN